MSGPPTGIERFELLTPLGAGAFGTVFAARDRVNGTTVALKRLHKHSADALYRFKKEFRALADLSHPNLVTLYELFQDGEEWFFSMELIDGEPLIEATRSQIERDRNQYRARPDEPTRTNPSEPLSEHSQGDATMMGSQLIALNGSVANSIGGLGSIAEHTLLGSIRDSGDTLGQLPGAAEPAEGRPSTASLPHEVDGPMPDEQYLRRTFAQLARGLVALHDRGMQHRDLKPSNVLVTTDGRVVILDFGVVYETHAQQFGEDAHSVVGTPLYMAPEQWSGDGTTAASDWYSFGIMLYEALTGVCPFLGKLLDLMQAKTELAAIAPHQLNPKIPEDLSNLCLQLLQAEPSGRPDRLEILDCLRADEEPGAAHPLTEPIFEHPFVGRKRELATLLGAFANVRQGEAQAIHVLGESGIGKTALCEHFVKQIQNDTLLLRGRCYQQESLPYKALDAVVDALSRMLRHLPQAEAAALLPSHIHDLAKVFPVLGQLEVVSAARRRVFKIENVQELKRRAFSALRNLVGRLAAQQPLVIWIDDLQWGDSESAALLQALMRPPEPPPLLLLLSYRDDEFETSPFLRAQSELEADLNPTTRATRLMLQRLSTPECESLVTSRLDPWHFVDAETLQRLIRETRGNPLFIEELLQFSRASGASLRSFDPGRAGESRSLALAAMLQHRLRALPEACRSLLEVVAIAGQPIDSDAARAAASIDILEPSTIHRLRLDHLIRVLQLTDRQEIAPYNARVCETVVDAMEAETRAQVHLTLAQTLETRDSAPPRVLANHFHAAGLRDKASTYAALAGDRASAALAFEDAASLYQQAISWSAAETPQTRQLRRKQADALVNAGRCAHAAPVYLKLAHNAEPRQSHLLRRMAAEQYLTAGQGERGLDLLKQLLQACDLQFPESERRAWIQLVLTLTRLRVSGLRYTERPVGDIDPDDLLAIDLCYTASRSLMLLYPVHSSYFALRALVLGLQAGDPGRLVEGMACVAVLYAQLGRTNNSLMATAQRLVQRLDTPFARGVLELWEGHLHFSRGHWQRAANTWQRAHDHLTQCQGAASELQKVDMHILQAARLQGRFENLSRRADEAIARARETGNILTEVTARLLSSTARLAFGDVAGARTRIRDAMRRAPPNRYTSFTELDCEIACDLYQGMAARALARIETSWVEIEASRMMESALFRVRMYALKLGCILQVAADSGKGRTNLLKQARREIKKLARESLPFARAHAALFAASVAEMRGKTQQALTLCEKACAHYDQAEMPHRLFCARRRHGQLLGGRAGNALIKDADTSLRNLSIANPARWTAAIAPGFDNPDLTGLI